MGGGPVNADYVPNFRSVQDLLATFYGGSFVTLPHDSDYTIGTTATALNSNRGLQRVGVLISNTGTQNFAISYSPSVTISTGVLLLQGGSFYSDWYYDGDLVQRQLWAVAAGAGGTLHMIERFLVGA
jgi:hypothetical protein